MHAVETGYSWQAQAASFAVFAIFNIGLNYFNSWALHDPTADNPDHPGFEFPFFYTMFHMLSSAIAAMILMLTCSKPKPGGLPSFQQLWDYKFILVPIGACTTLNNGLNNASLELIALFVNQVIKAVGPLPTWLLSWLLAGRKSGWKVVTSIFFIVGGAIMSNAHQMAKGGQNTSTGIIYALISMLAASLKPVLSMMVMVCLPAACSAHSPAPTVRQLCLTPPTAALRHRTACPSAARPRRSSLPRKRSSGMGRSHSWRCW